MTHGDKAKAKTGGKSSQASAVKKSSGPTKEAGAKGGEGKGSGKGASQGASKAVAESGKIPVKKAGAEKGNGVPAEKAAGGGSSGKEGGGKAKGRAEEPAGGFSNPAIGNAFRHAVKKYPNAFRKLTD